MGRKVPPPLISTVNDYDLEQMMFLRDLRSLNEIPIDSLMNDQKIFNKNKGRILIQPTFQIANMPKSVVVSPRSIISE